MPRGFLAVRIDAANERLASEGERVPDRGLGDDMPTVLPLLIAAS